MNKSLLLSFLISLYQVHISRSVFRELTEFRYPDSEQFRKYHESGLMEISELDGNAGNHGSISMDLSRMDRGESDTILLYLDGQAEFIIIDDGKGARFCHNNQIPFINALLFPRILAMTGALSNSESRDKFDDISGNGRYSERVIHKALHYSAADLEKFLPESPN